MTLLNGKQSVSSLRVLAAKRCLPREPNGEGSGGGLVPVAIRPVSPIRRPLLVVGALDRTMCGVIFGEEML